jgi:predicted enzyme related to lactoylglutathione lyase
MEISAKYVHTNLVARDWKNLANFYQVVFGCVPVPPERNLTGPAIVKATGIDNAHIRGMHMRLPGWGDDGPTLEIFSYTPELNHSEIAVNRPGFGHIAFSVDDVEKAKEIILASGGSSIGEIVKVSVGQKFVTFAYLADPEGNILEVQSWSTDSVSN